MPSQSRWSGRRSGAQGATLFTEAELTALWLMAGAPGEISAHALGLDGWTAPKEIQRVGLQSLVARGLADFDGTRVGFTRDAAWLLRLTRNCCSWAAVSLENESRVELLVALATETEGAMLAIQGSGTHGVVPTSSDGSAAGMIRTAVTGLIADFDLALPLKISIRLAAAAQEQCFDVTMADPDTVVPDGGETMPASEWWDSLAAWGRGTVLR